jgi:hypothetical protein
MPKPRIVKEHSAQVLAKKLQARGLHYTAAEVLTWPRRTFSSAKLWLEMGRVPWSRFMADDLPPPPANPGWRSAAPMAAARVDQDASAGPK